jgi:hypothetical protein
MSITNDSKNDFTVNVYLIFPDGTKSAINTSFLVSGSRDYLFTITPPQAGAYRVFFEFVGNGNNKDFVDQLQMNAPLFGTACSGDINFSITSNHTPGEFFPVGSTNIIYTAVCNSCVPVVSQTCSFNVVVNGVTANATKTDATCGLDNGTITLNAFSSNSSPNLQYSINNSTWVNFTSPVTITGLTSGTKIINVRDYFPNNSSYCQLLTPVSLTINRIIDTIRPVVNCPSSIIVEGCNVNAVTEANSGLVYSPVQQIISESQFIAAGGSASDNCGISAIKYQDSLSGICPVITRTFQVTDTNGNTTACSQSITIQDKTPPDYTAVNQEYCVQNILDVSFHSITIPDWYVFKSGITDLNINNLTDNCTPVQDLRIQWQIAFADGTFINGNGQPSMYGSDILFKGTENSNVNHYITYWITDWCGNQTMKKCTITIHPRSELNTN